LSKDSNFKLLFDSKYFTLYSIRKECRSSMLSVLPEKTNIIYQIQSPIKIRIKLTGLSSTTKLLFGSNYSQDWLLFLEPKSYYPFNKESRLNADSTEYISIGLDELKYLISKQPFSKTQFVSNGYANGWIINPNAIKSFGSEFYSKNSDGTINITLTLYYRYQLYFYIGTIIFFISLIILLLLAIKNVKK